MNKKANEMEAKELRIGNYLKGLQGDILEIEQIKKDCDNYIGYAVYFTNKDIGYIGTYDGKLYLTENGGEKWSFVNSGASPIKSLFFKSKSEGLKLSNLAGVISIKDDKINEPIYLDVMIVKGEKMILRKDARQLILEFNSMNFFDEKIGYAVGLGFSSWGGNGRKIGIIVTADGGETWFPISNENHERTFYSVSKNGFVVGEMGIILKIDKDSIVEKYKEIQAIIKK